jgi:hypothetical protein
VGRVGCRSTEGGADGLPGGGDLCGPSPGGVDAEPGSAGAAGDAGGDVQDSVTERGDLGAGQAEVGAESDEPAPGDQVGGGQRDLQPGGVGVKRMAGQVA